MVTVVLVVLAELVVVAWLSFLVVGVVLIVVIVIVVLVAVVVVGVSKFNTPSPNHKEEYFVTHKHICTKFHPLLYTCHGYPQHLWNTS